MAIDNKKFLDLTGLGYFKEKQDEYNASLYIPLTQRATALGVATLDATGKVPSSQLPSYVDDVESYANLDSFPATGEEGKIYVAEDTGKIYRWANSSDPEGTGQYINISGSVSTADEALKLTPGRTINGVLFDGTQNITIPTATASVAGTVLAGTNINLDTSTGTLSVNTGTASQKGVLQVGTNLNVVNGVISVATATGSALGVAQAGTNIDVANGVFSVKTGSASDLGVLKVGDNITVGTGANAGTISLTATNVNNALGYDMTELSTSDIDTLFA